MPKVKVGREVKKNLARLIFPKSADDSGGYCILLINCRDELVEVLQNEAFKDFSWEEEFEFDEGNLYNVIYHLEDNLNCVAIFDFRGREENPKIALRLLSKIDNDSLISDIILSSNYLSESDIKKVGPKIKLTPVHYLIEKDVEQRPFLIRDLFDSLVLKDKNALVIDNHRMMDFLKKTRLFKLLNFQFKNSQEDTKVSEKYKQKENDSYPYFFTFKGIIERLTDAFKLANLKFIARSLKYFPILEQLLYEKVQYSNDNRYRDHFIHQFRIALLGEFVLSLRLDTGQRVIDFFIDILREQHDEYRFEDLCKIGADTLIDTCFLTWWVTALMHDFSYPLYFVYKPPFFNGKEREIIQELFPEILIDKPLDGHRLGVKEVIKDFKKTLKTFLSRLKLNQSLVAHIKKIKTPIYNHGISTAFTLVDRYENQEEENPLFYPELAAQSILLHECLEGTSPSGSGRIDIGRYPFAFLLVLLDEIQDWDRPEVISSNGFNPFEITRYVRLENIEIRGIQDDADNPGTWTLDKDQIEIVLDYEKDDSLEWGDITKIWESKKKNLNRLHIGGNNFPAISVWLKFKDFEPLEIKISKR